MNTQIENNRQSSSEADKRSQSLQSIQQTITTTRSWSLSTTFAGSLRLYLLTSLSFVFGMEVAYKFATKQLIWLLNPCHVTSFVQMYLLASEATSKNNHVFQMMLHVMHGPVAALVFPGSILDSHKIIGTIFKFSNFQIFSWEPAL